MANMAAAERPINIYDDVVLKLKSCNNGIVTLNQQFLKNADTTTRTQISLVMLEPDVRQMVDAHSYMEESSRG